MGTKGSGRNSANVILKGQQMKPWTVELTVGDHIQNGFCHIARWLFPDEAQARAFIQNENDLIDDGAEPDHMVEDYTFILDLHEGDITLTGGELVDTSRNLPLQSAMRLAPDLVREWLENRPDPNGKEELAKNSSPLLSL